MVHKGIKSNSGGFLQLYLELHTGKICYFFDIISQMFGTAAISNIDNSLTVTCSKITFGKGS